MDLEPDNELLCGRMLGMFSPIGASPLQRYLKDFPDIPGFFQFESMVIWDFLLTAQERLGVKGNLLEIGVYKGKSAVLAALYMRPEEWCVFVDISPMPESEAAIRKFRPANNLFLQCRSGDLMSHRELREAAGTFRWCHVDADHTGYSTMHDMEVAAYLLRESGIICIDEFFNFRYPQLTAAVYQFLAARPFDFKMLFCGANKCYQELSEFSSSPPLGRRRAAWAWCRSGACGSASVA
jgi:hypothetical protein